MNAITGGLPHDAYNASMYDLLKTIDDAAQLRALDRKQLRQLADELRAYVLEAVSKTGGHLSSNLGTVELTIALHYIFDTPEDRIVWDVGHQTYPHKILTGRREAMARLRMLEGISGFPRRTRIEVRHLRHRAFVDLDFRRAGDGGRREAQEREAPLHRGHRRRRDVGRHGLRGA